MEAIMAEPTQEGQAPKTPVEVVAQVLHHPSIYRMLAFGKQGRTSMPTMHVYMNLKLKFS